MADGEVKRDQFFFVCYEKEKKNNVENECLIMPYDIKINRKKERKNELLLNFC